MFKLTFEDIRRRVKIGVDRDDLEDLYNDYINQAIREVENRRSFSYMKKSAPVTINPNEQTVSMPDDFKELVRQTSPIVRVTDTNLGTPAITPCAIYSRQRLESMNSSFGTLIAQTSGREQKVSILVDVDADKWFISLLSPSLEVINFRVNYYGYSERLTDNDAEHPLFTYYPNLVVAGTKYMIFQDINDPQKNETEQEFERQLLKAKGTDSIISFSGFDSHM